MWKIIRDKENKIIKRILEGTDIEIRYEMRQSFTNNKPIIVLYKENCFTGYDAELGSGYTVNDLMRIGKSLNK